MTMGVKIVISGLVQGVGFRYFVYRNAMRLGLRGNTRNLMNGSVEIEAEGERGLLEELIREVKVGPRSAQVRDVRIEWQKAERNFQSFEIL
jgi:acylphosphatase